MSAAWRRTQRGAAELRRRVMGRTHVVSAFLQIDDPYSYLLSRYLPALAEAYDIELRCYLSQALGGDYQPAPDLSAEYALRDCRRLARELGVPFLDKGASPPTELRVALTDSLASVDDASLLEESRQVLSAYWRGDGEAAARRCSVATSPGAGDLAIQRSQRLLQRLGHYNSAMLHYGGEWYWGIDRLHYLVQRLDDLGVATGDRADPRLASIRQAMRLALPVRPPAAARELAPLEVFHSPRSPYSYLGIGRLRELASAFGLELVVRPVLPMVMRGMAVPAAKLRYIAMDTAREAEYLGVSFGKFADPVGAGTERVLAVCHHAATRDRACDFLQNAGVAIWAKGIDVATDGGMRKVTEDSGLEWSDVVAAMADDGWRAAVEENRAAMTNAGCWGVPTVRLGDFTVWGQDRLWLLARHIEDLCDTGDGILV